jgi:sugar/nucleoside kinase (ribokinase family)
MEALHPVMHLNEMEALAFTGESTVQEAAEVLADRNRNTVMITLGSEGVYLLEQGNGQIIPAEKANVVDTIGAGDSHIGAVISMREKGYDFASAVQTANQVSAMVVGVKGPTLTTEEFRKGNF